MEKLAVKNSITIHAPASKVWHALTDPAETKKYMFGCETVSDWKPGSPLFWKMQHEGKDFIPVKGTILQIKPHRLLKYTVIDPHASYPDIPENHLHVTYTLTENQDHTVLTVVQDGFEGVTDSEKRYQDVYNKGEGWNPILAEIKKVVEMP